MMDGFIATLGGGLIGWTSGVGMSGVGQRLLKSEGVEGVQFASLPYSTTVGGEPTLATYSSESSVFGSRDSIYNKSLNGPLAIVLGSEEKGISKGLLEIIDSHASIPMQKEINSLNVSVACGITLFEIVRQRI